MGDNVSSFRPAFNGSVQVTVGTSQTSSEGGALALREALDASRVFDRLASQLQDPRDPLRVLHPLADQLRTLILHRAQGWIDQTDVRVLAHDPLLALCSSGRRGTAPLAQARPSQPTLSRTFALLATDANRAALADGLLHLTDWRLRSTQAGKPQETLTLDIDGVPIEVHGHQGGSAYHGYYRRQIYYPLLAGIAETGDLLAGLLRTGTCGAADEADAWIPKLVRQMTDRLCRKVRVRFDAGFTGDGVLNALEAQGIEYLGRLRGNAALDRFAQPHLRRPVGRRPAEPREWLHDLQWQGGSWARARRVVLVVQERPDDLFLHHFWIVTNLPRSAASAQDLLARYRHRGKAEAHFGELKSVLAPHLSCTDRGASTVQQVMARNEVSLSLSLYAYQLMHGLRCILAKETREGWSLQRLREQVLKVAATVTVHARRVRIALGVAAQRWWPALMRGLCRAWAVP